MSVLPEGHYYTLTWVISYSFGGMTTVVLERSSAFARQDNRMVGASTVAHAAINDVLERTGSDRANTCEVQRRKSDSSFTG